MLSCTCLNPGTCSSYHSRIIGGSDLDQAVVSPENKLEEARGGGGGGGVFGLASVCSLGRMRKGFSLVRPSPRPNHSPKPPNKRNRYPETGSFLDSRALRLVPCLSAFRRFFSLSRRPLRAPRPRFESPSCRCGPKSWTRRPYSERAGQVEVRR